MHDFIKALTPSDIINLVAIAVSLCVSVPAIIIAVLTLRQNSRMIEQSTRPVLQIYPHHLNSLIYIVVKNFGQSACTIDSISCDHQFTQNDTLDHDYGSDVFGHLVGAMFAPGYAIRCPLRASCAPTEDLEFKITYHSSEKTYSDVFCFNIYSNTPFLDVYASGTNDTAHLRNISRELRDLVKLKL